ncbi:MAG: glycine cleavage system protein GcvH [Proteobacteria bacterium]|nr:glycine cleavage system protein GcvH [Pseudomonadota bacterium]
MNHPNDRKYAATHEWIIADAATATYTIGISDYAQQALGDVVHATLPNIGQQVSTGEACCVLESVKAASDVHAPISGTIIAINPDLAATPEQINDDPYKTGWLFRIQSHDESALTQLMTGEQYTANL